jgi:hypothetical protein
MTIPGFVAVACLLVTATAVTSERHSYEALTKVNIEDVKPLLIQLETELGLDLPVSHLIEITSASPIGRRSLAAFVVIFGGSSVSLRYVVRLEDSETAALSFFAEDESLIGAIDNQFIRFANELER